MDQYSKNNTWLSSDGERYNSAQVERRIREAKAKKLEQMMDEHGYIFCEDCFMNLSEMLDCSHEISVDECKKTGRVELSWDIDNIKIRHRSCHQKHDGTTLGRRDGRSEISRPDNSGSFDVSKEWDWY